MSPFSPYLQSSVWEKWSKKRDSRWSPGEQGSLNQVNRLVWTHRDRRCQHGAEKGLYQVLCVYSIAFGLVFSWDSWVCEWESLWFLGLLLGLFSFLITLSSLQVMDFVISYILFAHVWLLSLRCLFFSKEAGAERENFEMGREMGRYWKE